LFCLAVCFLIAAGCRVAAPGAAADAAASRAAMPAADAEGSADRATRGPAAPSDDVGVRTFDGMTWASGERVDADVVRAKKLTALLVEANEIRCPRVVRSKSAAVPKDIKPWQIEGDVVEVDHLEAHTVSARLIVADEIYAVIVKKLTKPHRWGGAGGATPVRNRVTIMKGRAPSDEVPVF
jgi:hypothetical protein